MRWIIFSMCVFVYLVLIAGTKVFFHRYWFNSGNEVTSWDEISDNGASWLCAAFWPISIILFGIKKLADLIENEKEPPHAAD